MQLKKIIPSSLYDYLKSIKSYIKIKRIYSYDQSRFKSALKDNDYKKLEYSLMIDTHIIEKGLSHEKLRMNFGKNALINLNKDLIQWNDLGLSKNQIAYNSSISVLQSYVQVHRKNGYEPKLIKEIFNNQLLNEVFNNKDNISGSQYINLSDKSANRNFGELAMSRYSVREFDDSEISNSDLINAINIAQKSPSACNRQSSKVHVISNKDLMLKILNLQGGFRGYELPPVLLVTTVDTEAYMSPDDRNMFYIEGGMFTMSLLYALEDELIGACPLNTSFDVKKDSKIRALMGMNDSEVFINIIPIGYLKTISKVGKSCRRNTSNIIEFNN
ncbi:nitroreductase family protein [Companilactobacillus allii]|uniref:nitroreductase family protein n=1 Tax=Companilactobacillus allii TaxID=1847728 RepID=UPI00178CD317|nr:nitroreductase family protein [Companilactobacillus allii]